MYKYFMLDIGKSSDKIISLLQEQLSKIKDDLYLTVERHPRYKNDSSWRLEYHIESKNGCILRFLGTIDKNDLIKKLFNVDKVLKFLPSKLYSCSNVEGYYAIKDNINDPITYGTSIQTGKNTTWLDIILDVANFIEREKLMKDFFRIKDTSIIFKYINNNYVGVEGKKIAAFDLDSTLVTTKNGKPRGQNDYKVRDKYFKKLLEFQDNGYNIMILSNQRLRTSYTKKVILDKLKRIENIAKEMNDYGIRGIIFMATKDDEYRKPGKGFFIKSLRIATGLNWGYDDLEDVFYVGDAAGRLEDHSDCDIVFAKNLGIKFYIPEVFVGKQFFKPKKD